MKNTKIIATISDLKCDVGYLTELIKNGVNVVRLNTAHQTFEGSKNLISNVRKVSCQIPILIDTKGPEVRTRDGEAITVLKNDIIKIKGSLNGCSNKNVLLVNYKNFVDEIPDNCEILIDDGEVALKVIEKMNDHLLCRILNDGVIKKHKSINVPNVKLQLPTLTLKDKQYIDFAIENNVDYIAHSFVRSKDDVQKVKQILVKKNSKIKIIAKIENSEGVNNIEEILSVADGVMVARGDLAVELSQEKIPVIQKKIIKKCREAKKASIVATQMLHTMISKPFPTRAEVSDIANAIFDGTDAVMLSGETSYGNFPQEAVKMMTSIANETEGNSHNLLSNKKNDRLSFLSFSAIKAAEDLSCKAIIADTTSGRTICALSSYKGNKTIFAMCYNETVMRQVSLLYGVQAFVIAKRETNEEFKKESLDILLENNYLNKNDDVVIVAGSYGPSQGASFVEVSKVSQLLQREVRI